MSKQDAKHGHKQCLQADIKQDTSSASKQDTSTCTYVTQRTNEEQPTFSSSLTLSIVREKTAENA